MIELIFSLMKLKFIHQNFLIQIVEISENELKRVVELTQAWAFNWQKKEWWSESFLHNMTYMPAGLWMRVVKPMRAEGFKVELEGIENFIDPITDDELVEWEESQNLKYVPHWFQHEGVLSAIKFKISRNEFDTGAGKTFIIYLLSKFLLQRRLAAGLKVLIVVNRRNLVDQIVNKDFPDFCDDAYINCDTVFSGGLKLATSNVVVGTYQSLSGYDASYFSQFGALIVDECHGAVANSIKVDIMSKMDVNVLRYIHGLSATMHEENTIPGLTLESYLGPIITKVPLSVLQEAGIVADIKINVMDIKYPQSMTREFWHDEDILNTSKKLWVERAWVHRQAFRMFCIGQTCLNYKGNHVLMCESVDAVDRLIKYLQFHCPNHNVHRIIGGVNFKLRNEIQNQLETLDNNLLVATSETMGTGISIKNIHGIHLCDGGKSFIKIRQQIGRGVRLHPSKDFLMVFDWADHMYKDFIWPGSKVNSLYKQSRDRMKIYDNRKIPYTVNKLMAKNWNTEELRNAIANAHAALKTTA